MNKEVIFIADDFGITSEVNAAIAQTHVSGVLHGAALMTSQSCTKEAVRIAQNLPELQIGWHLHLNDSRPATLGSSEWPWGSSPAWAGIRITFSRSARQIMRDEIARQWDLFQNTGLVCRFVNCHHHLHAHPLIFETLVETLGPQFGGWIRLGHVRFFSSGQQLFHPSMVAIDTLFQRERKLSTWRSPDTLWGLDRLFAMKAQEVSHAIANLPPGFHEFLFHPRSSSCPDTRCLLELKTLLPS